MAIFSKEDLPDPADSDRFGRWSTYANERLVASDHLSQVQLLPRAKSKS